MSDNPHTLVIHVTCTIKPVARCNLLTWTLDSTVPRDPYVITALFKALVNNNTAEGDLLKPLLRVNRLTLNSPQIVKHTLCTKSA
jgi:hypothetical protein